MLPFKWEQFFTEIVYSLITYSHLRGFLYQTEIAGNRAGQRRERERERENEWETVHCGKGEIVSVIKWAVGRNTYGKIMWD